MIEWLSWPTRLPFQIEWEAWATLIVGIAAVLGAIAVGHRQTAVAQRQTEILRRQAAVAEKQIDLEHTRLRADLFDKRNAINADILTFMEFVSGSDDPIPPEMLASFQSARSASRHLFGPEIPSLALAAWVGAIKKRNAVQKLDRLGDDKPELRERLIDEIGDFYTSIAKILVDYHAAMNAYLGMAGVRAAPPDIDPVADETVAAS